jgi:hypothetical protein
MDDAIKKKGLTIIRYLKALYEADCGSYSYCVRIANVAVIYHQDIDLVIKKITERRNNCPIQYTLTLQEALEIVPENERKLAVSINARHVYHFPMNI